MRKLKLEVEALEVESFDASPVGGTDGTVFGHHVSTAETCSLSVDQMCDLPSDSVTADVYAGECNTIQCEDGGSLTRWGCDTKAVCG